MRPNLLLWLSSFVVIAASFCILLVLSIHPSPSPVVLSNSYTSASWEIKFRYPESINFIHRPLFLEEAFRFENEDGYMTVERGCTVYSPLSPIYPGETSVLGVNIKKRFMLKSGDYTVYSANLKLAEARVDDDRCLDFTFGIKPGKEAMLQVFDQILSTFEFEKLPILQPGQPTPPSGCYHEQVQCDQTPCPPLLKCPNREAASWPRYSNPEVGFEIGYPPEWSVVSKSTQKSQNTYFGETTLKSNKSYITIIYGDGFGGGSCSNFDGNLVEFSVDSKRVNFCHIDGVSSNNCGDCDIVSNGSTSFIFKVEAGPETDYYYLQDIVSTFKLLPQYSCPESEWVDCMPGPGEPKPRCQKDYLSWMQKNCSNFQGVAY